LFAVIGVTYGNVDANTFNIPDYRGEFLRGWDHGAANEPDRASRTNRGDGTTGDNIGTKQASQYKSHSHSTALYNNNGSGTGNRVEEILSYQATTGSAGTSSSGGNETRPRNVNVMPCIRYTGN